MQSTSAAIGAWLAHSEHPVAIQVRSELRCTYNDTVFPPAHPPTADECAAYYSGTFAETRQDIRQAFLAG